MFVDTFLVWLFFFLMILLLTNLKYLPIFFPIIPFPYSLWITILVWYCFLFNTCFYFVIIEFILLIRHSNDHIIIFSMRRSLLNVFIFIEKLFTSIYGICLCMLFFKLILHFTVSICLVRQIVYFKLTRDLLFHNSIS